MIDRCLAFVGFIWTYLDKNKRKYCLLAIKKAV